MEDKRKHLSKGAKITIIAVCLTILLVSGLTFAYFQLVTGLPLGKIIPNVSVAGVNVGGMTYREALQAVQSATAQTYGQIPMEIHTQGQVLSLSPELVAVLPDAVGAVREAYAYGRTGFPEERRQEQQAAAQNGHVIDLFSYMKLDTKEIYRQIEAFSRNFPAELIETSWELKGEEPDLTQDDPVPQTLVITKGAPGYAFDGDRLFREILDAYNRNLFTVSYQCTATEPSPFDIEALYEKFKRQPVDAVMDPDTFEVKAHINGYDFCVDSAKNQLERAEYGETVEIPFRVIPARITYQDLASVLFRDVLSTFTANAGSERNRDVNLRLSCEAINNVVLLPGEVFSYNPALGKRTPEKGYRPAGAYDGNKTVSSYGGGICQASSCLYYTALLADLDIVERVNHGFVSSYMPLGMDATVSWGGPEFRFRNSTDYPLRIDAKASGGSVTVTLVGTDTKDYYVKMEAEVLRKEEYSVVEKEMPPDNEDGYKDGQVITTPYTGYTVSTYRCKYDKQTDELISREHEVTSHYSKRNKEICKIVEPDA